MKPPSASCRSQSAFTLIEMLVVIAIIALLVSILTPVTSRALQKARDVKCTSKLRQLSLVIMGIASDNDGGIPRANDDRSGAGGIVDGDWIKHVGAYMSGMTHDEYVKAAGYRDESMFWCPAVRMPPTGPATIQYGMNRYFERQQWGWGEPYKSRGWRTDPTRYKWINISDVRDTSFTILLGDKTTLDYSPIIGPTGTFIPEARHNGFAHFVFVDGHVGSLEPVEFLKSERYKFLY